MNEIIEGHAPDVLRCFPDKSVQCVITSPPYYGLRQYGIPPQIWGGVFDCEHEWAVVYPPGYRSSDTKPVAMQHAGNTNRERFVSNVCAHCGAWRGELGLEPSPEMYTAHLVSIFEEVRRVLKDDGSLFLNLGDSYWGGKGRSGSGDKDKQRQRLENNETINKEYHQIAGKGKMRPQDGKHSIIKPKDLIGVPWMVAFALREAGWYLREDIIWAKATSGQKELESQLAALLQNHAVAQSTIDAVMSDLNMYVGSCMPESVADRFTRSHEFIFHFSKSKKYYFDQSAIKEDAVYAGDDRRSRVKGTHKRVSTGMMSGLRARSKDADSTKLQHRNRRSVLFIKTVPYPGAHYAVYPEELVEPFVLCGSRAGDCILDPFAGSGTTGAVSVRLGRQFVGIDLMGGDCDLGGHTANDRIACASLGTTYKEFISAVKIRLKNGK